LEYSHGPTYRCAVLSGCVGVAKLVGLDPKRLLVLRLRIGARYHPTLTSPIVDLDQSVDSWVANIEVTLEVGGSLALVGNELWNVERGQNSPQECANASVNPGSATILDNQDDLSSAS
jgi:hypothetical protein